MDYIDTKADKEFKDNVMELAGVAMKDPAHKAYIINWLAAKLIEQYDANNALKQRVNEILKA